MTFFQSGLYCNHLIHRINIFKKKRFDENLCLFHISPILFIDIEDGPEKKYPFRNCEEGTTIVHILRFRVCSGTYSFSN